MDNSRQSGKNFPNLGILASQKISWQGKLCVYVCKHKNNKTINKELIHLELWHRVTTAEDDPGDRLPTHALTMRTISEGTVWYLLVFTQEQSDM